MERTRGHSDWLELGFIDKVRHLTGRTSKFTTSAMSILQWCVVNSVAVIDKKRRLTGRNLLD